MRSFFLNPVVATTICTLLLGLFVVVMKWGLHQAEGLGFWPYIALCAGICALMLLIAFRVDAADKRSRGGPRP